MGLYRRGPDGLFDIDLYRPRGPALVAPIPRMMRRIVCAGCGGVAEVPLYGIPQVEGQVRLWLRGWRREPDTGRDFCPPCVPGG